MSCQAAKYPWSGGGAAVPAERADVHTLNNGYQRRSSELLVRSVDRPTRAALDYAAYHQNFMIADAEPEDAGDMDANARVDTTNPFKGALEKASLTADVQSTPLTESERKHPLSFAPMLEYLQRQKTPGTAPLEELDSLVRGEDWGLKARPGVADQILSELFLHTVGTSTEVWAKVEFQPWFHALGALPDQDGDGYPEIYGRVEPKRVEASWLGPVQGDYTQRLLTPAEVKTWANQLASYWYPSFNTDLVPPGAQFPDASTDAGVKQSLGAQTFASPTIVLRGKPQGKTTYQVFLIKDANAETAPPAADSASATALKLSKTKASPKLTATRDLVTKELHEHGGDWEAWSKTLLPFQQAARGKLQAMGSAKAIAGDGGFLFFRNGLNYVLSGDLEQQKPGKNPVPAIVEFQRVLAEHGVDFLFVPVPTKEELFPERVDPKSKALVGQIVQPYSRKFALSLAATGVEVVDLLPVFLAARSSDARESEPIFQHQDTHWTDRGLRLAANAISARVKQYPWFAELARHAQTFSTKPARFQRLGDLHSRLPENKRAGYKPESLVAQQVVAKDGQLYEDDADSPVVVLGDSFTGVYELTDIEHAGVSAHIAKEISYPVDLVMSYGGGPNVRNKLMRRGRAALDDKKVVIWIMTARDLLDYEDGWEPLGGK